MRALITGIAGQTGSYLAEALLARSWEVHGTVRPQDLTEPDLLLGASLHALDLTDFAGVEAVVSSVEPEVVINLAAVSSVARSWEDPVETAILNGTAFAALLSAVERSADKGRQPHVIQASSAEMFGSPARSPQDESTLIAPTNPYGAAKAFAHHLVGAYRARGLATSSIILYNHESPRRPEAFVTRKITAGAARIARGEQKRLALGNLEARRDWGWAPDYAEAIALVAEARAVDDFVVATGESHSVREFAHAALRRVGVERPDELIDVDERFLRPTDAVELVGDSSRIRARLGWQPTRTFDEIVGAMVDADILQAPKIS